MKQNKTKSMRKNRNKMRRSHRRYCGISKLGKFDQPFCPSNWEFIEEKDARARSSVKPLSEQLYSQTIKGELAADEKLCVNSDNNYILMSPGKKNPDWWMKNVRYNGDYDPDRNISYKKVNFKNYYDYD